jgi:hypothetical protein
MTLGVSPKGKSDLPDSRDLCDCIQLESSSSAGKGGLVLSKYKHFRWKESNTSLFRHHLRPAVMFFSALMCILFVGSFIEPSTFLSQTNPVANATPVIETPSNSWSIEGALTEACTCSVPCTCNFGEGPSPHNYCYALYSYEIRKGHYNNVTLDGLRFGATDLKNGRTIFIDEQATEAQREALRAIIARVILRESAEKAEAKGNKIAKDIRYTTIKQEYGDRRNRLAVKGIGEFSADYIMGLDKTQPVIVRNNTTWRIHDAIKAKTSEFRVKVGKDSINTKNTNSNQGDFEYSDKMDFGSRGSSGCGVCASTMSQDATGDVMCGM